MYTAKDLNTLMLRFALIGTIILIAAIIVLQWWENQKEKREKEKLAKEQEKINQNVV
jgi:FtsZ-interacting cell division protein ZipA